MISFIAQLQSHVATLRRAASDESIAGAPLRVFLFLNHELDHVEFRPVKIAPIAAELHLKPVTTAQAVNRLVLSGYLEPGRKLGRLRTYRLLWVGAPLERAG